MKPHQLDRAMGWRASVAAALAVGGLLLAPSTGDRLSPVAASEPQRPDPMVRLIVESKGERVLEVGRAAVGLGGRVVATQRSLGTVVVDVPTSTTAQVGTVPGVRAVTKDSRLRLHAAGYGPTGEDGDMTNVARLTGATTYWKNGFSGQGVDVALLDSGVLPVEGLTTTNKLVLGPDLSFESQQPNLRHLDTFGHGTHMAGIIAGRDSGTTPGTYATDNSRFLGMAPGSRVVSLKLADAQGNTDVSQVIAAIDWVIAHSRDAGLNIRVLNLSFGTDSAQDYRLDPLAHAAEVAWSKGIVVVVSAGNGDGTRTGLANPAYSPTVMAVGAVDTKGTLDRGDDVVPAFSQRGNAAEGKRAPDVVAPGVSVVSLRAKGSFVDSRYAATAAIGDRYFKGSGTSQSAAVVSGAAALLLSQRPTLTSDQVKDILRRSARWVPNTSSDAQGAGSLDLTAAYSTNSRSVASAAVHAGGGSLDKARGRFKVSRNGVVLSGEQDIFGNSTDTTDLAQDELAGATWAGGSYNGATWAGGGWTGSPLLGATWAGGSWTGATWAGATWAGATWAGATWAGATWAGATWAGNGWSGATWAGATWADAAWANELWASAGWS
ncbi:MAG TPA: S8 family serine peptidase [Actinomycetes bacterium]